VCGSCRESNNKNELVCGCDANTQNILFYIKYLVEIRQCVEITFLVLFEAGVPKSDQVVLYCTECVCLTGDSAWVPDASRTVGGSYR
jgi:hypothetical protein